MSKFISWQALALVAGLAIVPAAQAADSMHDMSGMTGKSGSASDMNMDQHLREMQDHMIKMYELTRQIVNAQNPQEKERLKAEQRQLMRKDMMRMKEMCGKGDMKGGMGDMQGHGNMGPAKPMDSIPPKSNGAMGGMQMGH